MLQTPGKGALGHDLNTNPHLPFLCWAELTFLPGSHPHLLPAHSSKGESPDSDSSSAQRPPQGHGGLKGFCQPPGPGPHLHSWPPQLRPSGPEQALSLPHRKTLPNKLSTLPSAQQYSGLEVTACHSAANTANVLSLGDTQDQDTRGGKTRVMLLSASKVHPQALPGAQGWQAVCPLCHQLRLT